MTAKELIAKLSEVEPDTDYWRRVEHILRMHRSKEWKKEQIYQMLIKFERDEQISLAAIISIGKKSHRCLPDFVETLGRSFFLPCKRPQVERPLRLNEEF